jgi:hypothetical protein
MGQVFFTYLVTVIVNFAVFTHKRHLFLYYCLGLLRVMSEAVVAGCRRQQLTLGLVTECLISI